jgi:hypothetical protein
VRVLLSGLLLAAMPLLCRADWTPPEHPDVQALLKEAESDIDAERNAEALTKLQWLYQNVLGFAPAMYGVRNSYLLEDWNRLAQSYPPAAHQLAAERDHAIADVRSGTDEREAYYRFVDVTAISRELNDDPAVRDLFAWLDSNKPELARRAYAVAQPALVRAHSYQLCGKYLEPEQKLRREIELRKLGLKTEAEYPDSPGFANHHFSNQSELMVALLMQNGRKDEAGKIAAAALDEWDDPDFRSEMAEALKGRVPAPWPQ